jgi:hydrogenase maturation protein HypF
MAPPAAMAERVRLRVRGRVQGVGFRPFVWGLAKEEGLTGFVANDGEGVLIEAQGAAPERLAALVKMRAPALARIDSVEETRLPRRADESAFAIRESGQDAVTAAAIGPDAAVCGDCLRELFDPANRRYLHPFITCTQCGPRYTITARLPYDRAQTSMAGFALCGACAAEYRHPADRRFHAETIACLDCGPRLSMPVAEIVSRLTDGAILAIKGIGGYHLACDARNEDAVAALRARKNREAKPFAVMVADLGAARGLAALRPQDETLLTSRERPIVVVAAREGNALAPSLAPGLKTIGLMLPPSPLHVLMFHEAGHGAAFVMTSANPGGEPLVIADDDAQARLSGIADAIVSHDRSILIRADDSVMRVIAGAPAFIRRARGFVPDPIPLGTDGPPVLALGGYLKTTLCVTRGREAFVSQHIGSLGNAAARRALADAARHFLHLLDVVPETTALDLHPDLPSRALAEELGAPILAVQHHHAHIASVLAEHGHEGPALGLALDGYGYGEDGGAWGGELLRLDGGGYRRLGHLRTLPLAGGDRAAREPWRMAAAALALRGQSHAIPRRFANEPLAAPVAKLLAQGNLPETSSAGRWFDAAAALAQVATRNRFESDAAMRLEAMVRTPRSLGPVWRIEGNILDLLPVLAALDGREGRNAAELFHGTLIDALADWVIRCARAEAIATIALGGGCFLNKVLAEGLDEKLKAAGLRVLHARALPPNDGGLSLGQAALARQGGV